MGHRRGNAGPAPDSEECDDAVLRVEVRADGTFAAIGELDLWSAPKLVAALAGASQPRVDLSGVTFIDVAGLRALRGVPGLRVVAMSPRVERLVSLSDPDGWSAVEAG